MTKLCCLTCEHCEAVEKNDDMILCCMLCGEQNAVPVLPGYVCHAYQESEMADFILSSELDDDDELREPPIPRTPASVLLSRL